jgi:HEAT repeat protein
VRYESVHALGKFKNRKVVDKLLETLKGGDNLVQIAACEALADIGDAQAAAAIEPLLSTDDIEVRQAAEKAISRLKPNGGKDSSNLRLY